MPKALRCSRCQHWLWMHLSASSVTHACLYYSMGRFVCCHQRGLSQTQRSSLITVKIVTLAWTRAKVWMAVRPAEHMCRGQQTHWSAGQHRLYVWMQDCHWLTAPTSVCGHGSDVARCGVNVVKALQNVCGDGGIFLYVHDISDNLLIFTEYC